MNAATDTKKKSNDLSTKNRHAVEAWKRGSQISSKEVERDNAQKELDQLLAQPHTVEAEAQVDKLYKTIAELNKEIGGMKPRTKKEKS